MSGGKILDQIKIELKNSNNDSLFPIYFDVYDSSLARKWLAALNDILKNNLHLEKNYCFFGFADGPRNGELILQQVNNSIDAINRASLGYVINDHFDMENCIVPGPLQWGSPAGYVVHDKFNNLHRYFEDLQGVSGALSPYYLKASSDTRWHIRQLNLLCHEFESWVLSWRKKHTAPEWQRPSQLMCWLHAPRFVLEEEDYELFGVETINRSLGGVYVGVNKAVGKHHWEVFNDEGRDSRIGELTTTTLRSQTEAAGDFDIEWGKNPANNDWQIKLLEDFRNWLTANGFDPEDKTLTIGHPQVGQVDLQRSFGTEDCQQIWATLNSYLDVYSVASSDAKAVYKYHWADADFADRQIQIIQGK